MDCFLNIKIPPVLLWNEWNIITTISMPVHVDLYGDIFVFNININSLVQLAETN